MRGRSSKLLQRLAHYVGLSPSYGQVLAQHLPLTGAERKLLFVRDRRKALVEQKAFWARLNRRDELRALASHAGPVRYPLCYRAYGPLDFSITLPEVSDEIQLEAVPPHAISQRGIGIAYHQIEESLVLSWYGTAWSHNWPLTRQEVLRGWPSQSLIDNVAAKWRYVTEGTALRVRFKYVQPHDEMDERPPPFEAIYDVFADARSFVDWRTCWQGDEACLVSVEAVQWRSASPRVLVSRDRRAAIAHAHKLWRQGARHDPARISGAAVHRYFGA